MLIRKCDSMCGNVRLESFSRTSQTGNTKKFPYLISQLISVWIN